MNYFIGWCVFCAVVWMVYGPIHRHKQAMKLIGKRRASDDNKWPDEV